MVCVRGAVPVAVCACVLCVAVCGCVSVSVSKTCVLVAASVALAGHQPSTATAVSQVWFEGGTAEAEAEPAGDTKEGAQAEGQKAAATAEDTAASKKKPKKKKEKPKRDKFGRLMAPGAGTVEEAAGLGAGGGAGGGAGASADTDTTKSAREAEKPKKKKKRGLFSRFTRAATQAVGIGGDKKDKEEEGGEDAAATTPATRAGKQKVWVPKQWGKRVCVKQKEFADRYPFCAVHRRVVR